MLILAIESSCDETACSLVENGVKEVSSSLATSKELHEKTGGVVPEVAARKQVESISHVIWDTLEKGARALNLKSTEELYRHIDAVAVTKGPGLAGSLIVGIEAAKALSLYLNKPLIPVNHLLGHIYGAFIENDETTFIKDPQRAFPAVSLVVSGGHTDLIYMKNHNEIEYLGGTLDDAAGEAFDKAARLMGLSRYLGGAVLSKAATDFKGTKASFSLPRPLLHDDTLNFSFSGLKTAVKKLYETQAPPVEELSFEFENAVIEVLLKKSLRALKQTGAKNFIVAGGVSANKKLRNELMTKVPEALPGTAVYIPPIRLCTDNAVYIASRAFFQTAEKNNSGIKNYGEIQPEPSLTIEDGVY